MFRMFQNLSLGVMLLASASLFAQYQPGSMSHGPGGMVQPAAPQVVVVPSSPSIYVVGGGLYGTGVYLVNPGTLPLQSTGISLAGRTGISLETPLQTGAFTGAPSLYQGGQPNYNAWPSYSAGGYSTEEAQAPESGRLINDLGPSFYGGDQPGSEAETVPLPSLGEIAAQYRAHHPRSVRTFTNADAERLSNTISIGAGHVNPPPAQPQENKPKEQKRENPQPRT
jgi:hypothetical protein